MNNDSSLLHRAEALLEQRLLPEALECFHRAEAAGADAARCCGGRWIASALQGDLDAAWHESDAIRSHGGPDPHRFWQGEDISGKRVIVRCLHGFGDTVQFLRYAPLLRSRCENIVVECAPQAVELIRCISGVDEVISWGADAPPIPPTWDVQIEVMELPYLFRSSLSELPIATNYLRLSWADLFRAHNALGPSSLPRVGIVWSSGEWNPSRNLPFEFLPRLLSRKDCQFWNLQGGRSRTRWQTLGSSPHLKDSPLLSDAGLVPLASVVAQLDLVITVDTLAAHLAGALNVPCWLLLQHAADWRWMIDRDDSPWYPSLRLFRQPVAGDWQGVVDRVSQELQTWVAERPYARAVA
ncbi:hypothetical protein JAO29_22595 [Edaphobacter sp. HDX4]|uniref:glycosyltransferase family 9 protein n=1 Tax=Edaphobacter sp. HDX4 TaxID=2794064 RepID=UPI002FE5A157